MKIALLIGGAVLGLALAAVGLYLAIAFARVVGLTILQWRELFSLDRWLEILSTTRRRKVRTLATTISVAWGIFALVFLLGLAEGFKTRQALRLAGKAMNGVSISAWTTTVPYRGYPVGRWIIFDDQDYERLREIDGIENIAGRYTLRTGAEPSSPLYPPPAVSVRRDHKAGSGAVLGVHPGVLAQRGVQNEDAVIVAGRFISDADVVERRKTIVLGTDTKGFLFGDASPIGEWIFVMGVPFQVVGVVSDPNGDQNRSYVPVSSAQHTFNGGNKLDVLSFTVRDPSPRAAKATIDRVVRQLAERYAFDPKDEHAVAVVNNVDTAQQIRNMTWMISAFVIAIGIGTLAAGVVGVSNIMMISVKERTKEIGVRKALGARARSIVFMIVQETVLLTFVTGLFGLAGANVLLRWVAKIDNEFVLNPRLDLSKGLAALGILVVAGVLAGYFPARAAARVNPIQALSEE